MAVKIYNTLSRSKESFIPNNKNKVGIYVCGPTVYDYIHIGNARVFIVFDVMRRYLESCGYGVTMVQNITDIDDKMINRANEMGISLGELAAKYIQAFKEDLEALKVRPADFQPRATDHIEPIIKLIEVLLENGHAYISNGDVYYDTESYPEYGMLSGQNKDTLLAGARIEPGEKKKNPLDFVLWKEKKKNEPFWPSPWGDGRPGWHIECSAMSTQLLEGPLDIHAGGADLIFPHHENEIAQTWGAEKRPLARYWVHAGYLNIEEQKMSKSLGNVKTVRHLIENHDPLDLRFLILSAHYRSPLNFSASLVKQSRAGRLRLQEMVNNLYAALPDAGDNQTVREEDLKQNLTKTRQGFIDAMDDDFNTADAIGVLFDLARQCNIYLKEGYPYNREIIAELIDHYSEVNGILTILTGEPLRQLNEDIDKKIARRDKARADKDWVAADQIRDELLTEGIVLEDTPHGTRWKRKLPEDDK